MATTREQMKRESRATLIHEWDHGKERYRLLAVGRISAGYEDSYVIEELGSDGMGEPRWTAHAQWNSKDSNEPMTLLVGAVKSLQRSAGTGWPA